MEIVETAIPAVRLFIPRRFADDRGWLAETWRRDRFAAAGIDATFVQDNAAFSRRRGTVRGLHFQAPPHAQGKLIAVVAGAVIDVALDLRQGSPTYGRHVAAELTAERGETMWVPPGFAHGFCTLSNDTLVTYKMTAHYAPSHERGVRWDDPALSIAWPVEAGEATVKPLDRELPLLADLGVAFPVGSA